MREPVWSAADVTARLATAYHTAASAAADMHRVTGALESLRAVLSSPDPALTVWDRLDDRVGDAFERPEAPAVVGLRATFVEALGRAAIADVRAAYARSAAEGWEAFLTAFADGAVAWRFELCEELVQSPVATPGNEHDRAQLATWTRHAINERWYEAYPMFRLLADQAFLPSAYIARFVSVQGLIELYHLFRRDRARVLIERALELAPNEPAVVCAQGEYLLHGDDVPGARARFERAQAIDPLYASAPLLLGDCCLRENDLASAAAWYRQTAEKFPGNFSAATRLCRLAGKQTDLVKIEETIHPLHRRCEFIEPHTVYSFELEAGAACQEAKHVERAHEWFERAIARDPARIGGYTSEGYLFLEQGRWDDARRYFLKVIEVAPEALDGYWGLARVEEQAGEWQQVQKWYDAALPSRPEWEGMIRASIAYALNKLGKTEEAEACALQAIRSDPSDEATLERVERVADDLARAHHDPAAAVRLYDGFLGVLGPSYEARYRNQIGVLKSNAGDHSAAAAAFAEAVKADPEKTAYRISLARELRQLRAWDMGASLWTSASARVQADASFRTEMALLRNAEANEAYDRRQYQRAVSLYEEAVALTPSDAVLHSNLAIGREQDRSDRDLESWLRGIAAPLREAARLAPSNNEYRERLKSIDRLLELAPTYGSVGFDRLPVVTPIAMEVGTELIPLVEGSSEGELAPAFRAMVTEMRGRLADRYGVQVPGIRVRGNTGDLPPGSYIIMLMEVPLVLGQISLEKRFCTELPESVRAKGLQCEPASLAGWGSGSWIARADWDAAAAAGLTLWDAGEYMVRHLESILERNLADFVGVNEAAERMMATCPDLLPAVEEAEGGLAAFAGVLRALVAERTPIAELRAVCERYLACRQESVPLVDIAEEVRLLPEIMKHLAGNTAGTGLITMDDRFEQTLLAAIHRDGPHSVLVLKPEACQEALRELREKIDGQNGIALVAEAAPVRPFLRKLIELEWPEIPVLTRRELITELQQAAEGRAIAGVALGAGPALDATDLNAANEAQR